MRTLNLHHTEAFLELDAVIGVLVVWREASWTRREAGRVLLSLLLYRRPEGVDAFTVFIQTVAKLRFLIFQVA